MDFNGLKNFLSRILGRGDAKADRAHFFLELVLEEELSEEEIAELEMTETAPPIHLNAVANNGPASHPDIISCLRRALDRAYKYPMQSISISMHMKDGMYAADDAFPYTAVGLTTDE